MDTRKWSAFPHDATVFTHTPERLRKHWAALHRGDCEPFPDAAWVSAQDPKCKNPEHIAEALQQAWIAFHRGDFADAVRQADALGLIAHAVANKACGIYADYLEDNEKRQVAIYQAAIKRAEKAIEAFPDHANSHYLHAFLVGRYSQCISVAQALAQGLGGQVQASLKRALDLAPDHAEALTAQGLFNAEIIDKVGKLVGSMTYGASADKAMAAFERALALTPKAPIAHIEYGNGLHLLFGDDKLEQSNAAYQTAAKLKPIDAMQQLDVAYAQASI